MNVFASSSSIAFNPNSLHGDRAPVIRSYALSVDAFDFLKFLQRECERELGFSLTNGQALEAVLKSYADLRAATVDNPEWDFDAAYDASMEQGAASGRLRPVAAPSLHSPCQQQRPRR